MREKNKNFINEYFPFDKQLNENEGGKSNSFQVNLYEKERQLLEQTKKKQTISIKQIMFGDYEMRLSMTQNYQNG